MFLKVSQNGQHDHIMNAEVLYICIFAVLANYKKRVLMFNKRKTYYNIHSTFSFENFHKITRTIGREF